MPKHWGSLDIGYNKRRRNVRRPITIKTSSSSPQVLKPKQWMCRPINTEDEKGISNASYCSLTPYALEYTTLGGCTLKPVMSQKEATPRKPAFALNLEVYNDAELSHVTDASLNICSHEKTAKPVDSEKLLVVKRVERDDASNVDETTSDVPQLPVVPSTSSSPMDVSLDDKTKDVAISEALDNECSTVKGSYEDKISIDILDKENEKRKRIKKQTFLAQLPLRKPKQRDIDNSVIEVVGNSQLEDRVQRKTIVTRNEYRTVREMLRDLDQSRPSCGQAAITRKVLKKGGIIKQRHTTKECSYPVTSVDEKRLTEEREHILRYSWKGRSMKLRSLLSNRRDVDNYRDINRFDSCGRTAAHFAASWGDYVTLQTLMSTLSIDLNRQDDEGKTPLYKAVEVGSFKCVGLLLLNEANPLIADNAGLTPFDYALHNKGDDSIEIIKLFLQFNILRTERIGFVSALHRLAVADPETTVHHTAQALIEAGADFNTFDADQVTPLMLAAKRDDRSLVNILLDANANARMVDARGETALDYCLSGNTCYNRIQNSMNNCTNMCSKEEKSVRALAETQKKQKRIFNLKNGQKILQGASKFSYAPIRAMHGLF